MIVPNSLKVDPALYCLNHVAGDGGIVDRNAFWIWILLEGPISEFNNDVLLSDDCVRNKCLRKVAKNKVNIVEVPFLVGRAVSEAECGLFVACVAIEPPRMQQNQRILAYQSCQAFVAGDTFANVLFPLLHSRLSL